jgi:hypothetical protein
VPLTVTVTADDLLRRGPTIRIQIGNPADPFKSAIVNALVDTGAAFTAINPRLSQSVQLIQRGMKRVRVPGNTKLEDTKDYPEFAASIGFPDGELRGLRVHGVVACPVFEREFSCLIGRDILKRWEFTYNGALGQFQIVDFAHGASA